MGDNELIVQSIYRFVVFESSNVQISRPSLPACSKVLVDFIPKIALKLEVFNSKKYERKLSNLLQRSFQAYYSLRLYFQRMTFPRVLFHSLCILRNKEM